jgi:hypothetical protein
MDERRASGGLERAQLTSVRHPSPVFRNRESGQEPKGGTALGP